MAKNNQFKKGFTPWNKGKKGLQIPWNKGKKGVQISTKKGVPLSEEVKKKISKSKKGTRGGFTGKKHSALTIEKIRSTKIASTPRGEKSHRWKNGTSKIDRVVRRVHEYFLWRTAVFQRDSWTCQTCSKRGVYVTAHHIKAFSLILRENNITDSVKARKCKELWDISNGVTLCEECHSLTDNYKVRLNKKKL